MKSFLIALMISCILVLTVSAASAKKHPSVPLPPESPWGSFAQATNPDPFNRARVGQADTPPTPVVVQTTPQGTVVPAGTPVVVQAAPAAAETSIWIQMQTAFMGILTLLFGKLALFTKKADGGIAIDSSKVGEIVKAALHGDSSTITDPSLRDAADLAILRAVQSGIPARAIQTGLSMIPGVGPLVSQGFNMADPMLRSLVEKIVQERMSAGGVVRPVTT